MSWDMRRECRLPWWLMYATVAVLFVRASTCLSCSSVLKRHRASHTASTSRQLICHCSWGPVQSPAAACPLHMAPQTVVEASGNITTCLCTCARETQDRGTQVRGIFVQHRGEPNTPGLGRTPGELKCIAESDGPQEPARRPGKP